MAGAKGEAKANGLGCTPAATLVKESLHRTHAVVNDQCREQSFVTSPHHSLALTLKLITNCNQFSARTKDATWRPDPTFARTLNTDNFCNTPVHDCAFDVYAPDVRDLTSGIDPACGIMTSAVSAPGTPPELSESRSSKSSSCGSDFSADRELSSEIADINFEDIGLDDENKSDLGSLQHGQTRTSSQSGLYHTRRSTLHNAHYQSEPRALDGTTKGSVSGLMKRGFTSPSPMTVDTHVSRTRSTSPPKQFPRSASAYSVDLGGSIQSVSPRSSLVPSRRGSWQPQRKTIKELEAECHDSDEELPDDANLWNVPVSPLHSAGTSPRSSFRASPDRDFTSQHLRPVPLEHTRSASESSPRKSSFSKSVSRHRLPPRSSSANLSRSNPTSPVMPNFLQNNRSKSWNLAMSDLSPEARVISENLEFHIGTGKLHDKGSTQAGQSNQGSAPSTIKLPPIQRGTLDFMPISKEKEAVLSRTRPSWLPPKDPKEEQKHLKEYQKMMAASIEAEKKRESKQKLVQSQKDDVRASLNRIWDFYVEPSTDIAIIDRRVHDLCWRGIPARVRGKVWQRTIGNPLGLSATTYTKARERAAALKSKESGNLSQLERSIALWFMDIERDAETAFPELGLFQRNGPLWHDLVNLCEAYTCYRSDIGYFYGIQLVAALILVQIPEPSDAFIFMANCLNRPIPMAFHASDIASTQRTYNRVISNLGVKFPRIHDYLFEPMERGGLGLSGHQVLEPMFRTMFSNGLDLDRLCRIWDVWIFEGDRTLVRTAVAILGSLQSQIFDVTGDLQLKRRNVQEMLGWGPFNRNGEGSYWMLDSMNGVERLMDEIEAAGKLDYTGH